MVRAALGGILQVTEGLTAVRVGLGRAQGRLKPFCEVLPFPALPGPGALKLI